MQQSVPILLQDAVWEWPSPDKTSTGHRTTGKMHDLHFNGWVTIPVLLGL
jgi:hypothetical protein